MAAMINNTTRLTKQEHPVACISVKDYYCLPFTVIDVDYLLLRSLYIILHKVSPGRPSHTQPNVRVQTLLNAFGP